MPNNVRKGCWNGHAVDRDGLDPSETVPTRPEMVLEKLAERRQWRLSASC